MSSQATNKRFNKKRLICLVICAVLLISSVVAVSFAWFRGIINSEGGTVKTGKIIVNAAGYQVSGSSDYAKIFDGSIDGTQTSLKKIEPAEGSSDTYDIKTDENGEYTVFYVVQKTEKSIDVDVQLKLAIKEGANDQLNGFVYYLSAVDVTLRDPSNEETVKSDLASYLSSSGALPNGSFMRNLSVLASDFTRVTLTSERSYAVIRFSVRPGATVAGEPITKYSGQTYKLWNEFTVAQVGHITDENTGNLWLVSTLSEFESALKLYVPGDTIRITNYINWSGDLNFNRPVRFELMGALLTVNGNVNFTYAYSGDFYFDASGQGQLLVVQQGGYGGNFNIDTPLCNVHFNGSGNNQPSQGDLYLRGNLYANVNFDDGVSSGLTLNRIVIRNSATGSIADDAPYKGVVMEDSSKVNVSANTYISEINVRSPDTEGGENTNFIRVENRGEIGELNLSTMTEVQQTTLEYPQIDIHNYTTIDRVNLPTWSVKWVPSDPPQAGQNQGNTRIRCELGAAVTLNEFSGFREEDIEYPNADLERVELVDGDPTHLRINYFLKQGEESISFEKIIDEFLLEHPELGVEEAQVTNLEVVCYGYPMSPDDYAYINGCRTMSPITLREDGKGFPNVVTLDLSGAYSVDRLTPDYVFNNLKFLAHLELPKDNTWGLKDSSQAFATGAPIEELYIPETYTVVNANVWSYIKYLHIQNIGSVVLFPGNFRDSILRNVFLANETMVSMYRSFNTGTYWGNNYASWPERFALEGTHYGNLWANILPDGTAQITAYDRQLDLSSARIEQDRYNTDKNGFQDKNGNQVAFDYQTLTINGVVHQVSEIYSYAFQNLIGDLPELRFGLDSANSITIGNNAFYGSKYNKAVAFENPNATVTIGANAFRLSEQLRTLDIAGPGTIGQEAFRDCKNLRYAICPKITSLGISCFWTCNMLYVADFPCVTQTMYTFSAPLLEFARTGVISQIFPGSVSGLNSNWKSSDIFGWRSRLRLYLINSPKSMPADMDVTTLFNPFGTNSNDNANAVVRSPMPSWLYDLYYALPTGFAGDKVYGGLSHANNTSEYCYEDYRYANWDGSEFVECDSPYELQYDATGEITGVKVCDIVYIVQQDGKAMLVCCNVDDAKVFTNDSLTEFATPDIIRDKGGSVHQVSVIGDRAFGWTSIPQAKLAIADTVETIEDMAFTIIRPEARRNGLNYAFDEVDLANVEHIGRYSFFLVVYNPRALDIGFSVISGGEKVQDIGEYAFAYNELYAFSLPEVKQIDYAAFYGNANLYAVNIPKFQRENDSETDLRGAQFEGCPNLSYVFVGPVCRLNNNTFNNNASVFVDATQKYELSSSEPLLKAFDVNHYFLRYSEETDFTLYKNWIKSSSYISCMFSEAAFDELYVFGNQEGRQFEISELFNKDVWTGEGVTQDTRPVFVYRLLGGDEVTMVAAHGKFTGEYRVVDKVGTYRVTQIGWNDYQGSSAADTADYYSSYGAAAYAFCDLSEVTKLYFQSDTDDKNPADKTNIERLNKWAFYRENGSNCLGYKTWNTETGCLVDITGIEWLDYYAFTTTCVSKVYSKDVNIGFGNYVFAYCYHLTTFEAPNAKTFGGRMTEDNKYDETSEFAVFYACTDFSTVILPEAETMYALFHARSDMDQSLEEVYLPKLKHAYNRTFKDCKSLWRVALGTESNELTIGYYAFQSCVSLVSVTLGHEGITNVVLNDHSFYNTTLLTEIGPGKEVVEGDGRLVETTIGGTPVKWTNVGFEYVTEIGTSGLNDCNGVTSINLPNLRLAGTYAFANNEQLLDINLGSEGHDVYLNGYDVFYQDPLIVELSLPYVTKGDYGCFGYMPELVSITLENIRELGGTPFRADSKLANIYFGHDDPNYTFAVPANVLNGTEITSVYWPYVTELADSAFDYRTTLETVNLPNVRKVGAFAFRSCRALATTEEEGTILGSEKVLKEYNGVHLGPDSFYSETVEGTHEHVCFPWVGSMDQYDVFYNNTITKLELPNLHTVTLSSDVNRQGRFAFVAVYGLEELDLGKLTTIEGTSTGTFDARSKSTLRIVNLGSLKTIPVNYFSGCTALTTVDVSAAETLDTSCFYGCTSLTTISLPKVTTLNGSVFSGCTSLETINWPTAMIAPEISLNGTSIFANCNNYKTLDCAHITYVAASAFESAKIETLRLDGLRTIDSNIWGGYFTTLKYVQMNNLTSISVMNFNLHKNNLMYAYFPLLESVNNSLFSGCVALENVNIYSATTIGNNAFDGCRALTCVLSANAKMVGSYAFRNCALLDNHTRNMELNLSKVRELAEGAFQGCAAIHDVDLTRVQKIYAYVFQNCTSLNKISPLGSADSEHENKDLNVVQYVELLGSTIFGGCPLLTTLESDWVSNLGTAWLFNTSSITTLKLNGKLTKIDTADLFAGYNIAQVLEMDALTHLDAGSLPTSYFKATLVSVSMPKLESVPTNFCSGCTLLQTADVSGATTIGNSAFSDCTSLNSALIDKAATIGSSVFNNCGNLSKISQTEDNTLGFVSSIGASAFANCGSLKSFIIAYDESVAEDAKLTELGSSVFSGCTNLDTVKLPTLQSITGTQVFRNCSNLTTVEVPMLQTVTGTGITGIFENCSSLETIQLPNLKTIGASYMFSNCTGLREISLPAIETMSTWAFNGCTSLTSVVLGPQLNAIGSYNFVGCVNLGQLVMESEAPNFYLQNKGYRLFSDNSSDLPQNFRLLVSHDIYEYIRTASDFGGSCFGIRFADHFVPKEISVPDDHFNYYVTKINTVADTDYYQVVYITPIAGVEIPAGTKAVVPDYVELGGTKYNIISVVPTAWAGLTEEVTEIEFPRRMAVFHNSSMIYMPSSVAKFSIPDQNEDAGDSLPNYFQVKDGMLFDSAGWTLVAVPKAYTGVNNSEAVVIGEGALADVNVISANAFYGSSIKSVFVGNKAVYINSSAFARSALEELWLAGTEDTTASYFIGSDIFNGTSANIYVHTSQRTRYTYRDIGSDYLLGHLFTWGGADDEHSAVPDYSAYVIPA